MQKNIKHKTVKTPRVNAARARRQSRAEYEYQAARHHQSYVAAAVRRMYSHSGPLLICEALLFAVVGILMLIKPLAILSIMTIVIGIGLVLFGLYRTVAGFVVQHDMGGGAVDVVFGLINIVLGVLFCVFPIGSVVGLMYIFVVLFLFKAIRALVYALNMARVGTAHSGFDIAMSILLIVIAVALLFFPILGVVGVVYYVAIALIVYAIFDIYMFIQLLRLRNYVIEE